MYIIHIQSVFEMFLGGLKQVMGSFTVSSAIEGSTTLFDWCCRKIVYRKRGPKTIWVWDKLVQHFKKFNWGSQAWIFLCKYGIDRIWAYSQYHVSKCWQRNFTSPSPRSSRAKEAGWDPSELSSSTLNELRKANKSWERIEEGNFRPIPWTLVPCRA